MVSWKDIIGFLRCISRTGLGPGGKERIVRFSGEEVPWENVRMIAEMEGVSGFLHVHLLRLELLNRLPPTTRASLEKSYERTTERTLAYVAEMKSLSKLFKNRGIPVTALQGLSLVPVYGDPGLRPFGDADLMVKPSHKERLWALFQEIGYMNPMGTHPDIFVRDPICIDVHTHVLNLERIHSRRYLFPVDLTPMWNRAKPLFDPSGGLLAPDPHDNLIALSAHALKHGYSRLFWLVDLHESLERLLGDRDSHERILERAVFWRQERIVLYALELVEGIFGMKIPPLLKQGLGGGRLSVLERSILSRRIRGHVPRELFILLFLRNIRGIANKTAFLRETVLPRDEILRQTVDKRSHRNRVFMYAKRVFDTMARAGRILAGS